MPHLTEERALTGRRVLVAEDDPFIAAELRELLAREGAEILGPVPTVRAALAMIDAETPDAAVLDVNLRDDWSAPVAEALQAIAVPIVLVTGYTRELLEHASLREAPMLPKPLQGWDLLSTLDRLLSPERAHA